MSISVNGQPLSQYIDAEQNQEIEELRRDEISERTWRAPASGSKFAKSKGRSTRGTVLYSATPVVHAPDDINEWVMIGASSFPYAAKAPFTASGRSIYGAMEWDKARDALKCHECGKWHAYLAKHVTSKHQMSAREYKWKHGINLSTGLLTPALRSKFVEGKKQQFAIKPLDMKAIGAIGQQAQSTRVEVQGYSHQGGIQKRNLRGTCPVQIPHRLRQLWERFGRVPTVMEIKTAGIEPQTLRDIYGSVAEAIRLAGLTPRPQGIHAAAG